MTINRFAKGPYCSRWFLHNFRHTYATRNLQDASTSARSSNGWDIADIASTMVYLKVVRNRDIQARINKGSLAALA